jgi:hypothetical protein
MSRGPWNPGRPSPERMMLIGPVGTRATEGTKKTLSRVVYPVLDTSSQQLDCDDFGSLAGLLCLMEARAKRY